MAVIWFNYFPLVLKKRNIPFADYGSMQYFVEKVKNIIYLLQTMQHYEENVFFL